MKKMTLILASMFFTAIGFSQNTFAIYTEDTSIGEGVGGVRFSNGNGFQAPGGISEPTTTPYEGTKNFMWTYNNSNSYVHGILIATNGTNDGTGDITVDLSSYSYYKVAIRTVSDAPFFIRMRGNGITSKVRINPALAPESVYGFENDGEWHFLSIPFTDFIPDSPSFSLTSVSEVFVLRSDASSSLVGGVNDDFEFDNIYVSDSDSTPPVEIIPTTQVEELCGQILPTVNSKVFFDHVIGATEYTYSVTSMTTNEEQLIISPNRFFYFTDLESFELGTVYAVKGKAQVGGNYGEYGAVCNVTTPLLPPSSQLRPAYCNTTLANLNDNIYANFVVGATMYKFRVANDVIDQEIERPDSRFSMAFATGVTAGTMYNVTVSVMINGVWGPYGNVCTIETPAALPTSQLRPQFCNGTVAAINSNFYAVFRSGAVAYKFKTMINGEEIEVVRPDSRCFMSAFTGATMSQMYSIQVAVKFGDVWSDYGDACNLTVGMLAPPKLQLIDGAAFNIKAYPNPFVNQITLSLSNENMQSHIMVYDMTGKLIQQVSTEQTSLEIGNDWSKGIYLAQIVQGQETKNIRIVKQ